ncbi:uncharacterized protein LOC141767098 [Sebastes fasciatus]|uniref:uncharacterized protein LOC141767098 n=1 Tax=Sebastes fasciatus TaxID=394691 RepID=UPI003D9DCBA6
MEYVGKILTLSKSIIWMVAEAKANKKRCRRLAERVKAMEELVESIKRRGSGQISTTTNRALWQLYMTLTTAEELVRKSTKTKFLNQLKCKSEFNSVNESLNDIFQVLSGALQVEQGSVMLRMFQDYTVEEEKDDWDDGFGLFRARAPMSYSGAMAPVSYSDARAPVSYSDARAPVSYSGARDPVCYPAAATPTPYSAAPPVYTSVMKVEDATMFFTEGFFLA